MTPVILAILLSIVVVSICVFGAKKIDRSINIDICGRTRNYKIRYNPSNRKYYIANETTLGDIDVLKYGLYRIYFKSKLDAYFVMEKLNEE